MCIRDRGGGGEVLRIEQLPRLVALKEKVLAMSKTLQVQSSESVDREPEPVPESEFFVHDSLRGIPMTLFDHYEKPILNPGPGT